MLSLDHQAAVLRKAGIALPAAPHACAGSVAGASKRSAQWASEVQALFAAYALERARRSLQQD